MWPLKIQAPAETEVPHESTNATRLLDLVHCDLQGLISNWSRSGTWYFNTFLDEASGLSIVRLMKPTRDSAHAVNERISQMVHITDRKLIWLCGDN